MAKKKSKKSSRGTAVLWKALFLLVAIACMGFFLLVALVQNNAFGKLPDAADLAALRNEEATLILASNGAVIGKVFGAERTG